MNMELLRKPIPGTSPSELMPPEVCNQFQMHAMEMYPQECVGYVKYGQYHRLENVSQVPEASAKIDPVVMLGLLDEGIDVFCHSHPDGPDCPSAHDLKSQHEMAVPWSIVSTNGKGCLAPFVWGEGVAKPPLLGRPFRHGLEDCYGLIRDFYAVVMGIELADAWRDWEWWRNCEDSEGLYEENFAKWGFSVVEGELEVGDVFLLRAGARVPNHAGIYLGDHLMLHHLSGRSAADVSCISTVEPTIRWAIDRRLVKTVRYGGK